MIHFIVFLPKNEPTPIIRLRPLPILPGLWVFRGIVGPVFNKMDDPLTGFGSMEHAQTKTHWFGGWLYFLDCWFSG
jgi:hypothetical protein